MYAEKFDRVIAATTTIKSYVPNKQVLAITSKFLPALDKNCQETKGEIRKAFSKAYNTFASLRDGVKGGEVTKKDFEDAITEMQSLRKVVAKAELPAKPKKTTEEVAINDSISDSGDGRNGHLEDRGREVMRKYQKFEHSVPNKLVKKRYTAIKLPIVAVTDPLMHKDRLAKYKLCDDTIFGYPFVKNQTLIGMSTDWVRSEFKMQAKPAIEAILELLKESTKIDYIQLGVSKMRGHVLWVWVASARDMGYLNAAAGGHFKVTGWDFPFEVTVKQKRV